MKYLYVNKHWSIDKEYNIDKLLYLMIDRPNEIYNVEFVWTNNKNKFHRDYDLPAKIYIYYDKTCNLCWYKNHKYHRERSKPSFVRYDGYRSYWTNDRFIKEERSKK